MQPYRMRKLAEVSLAEQCSGYLYRFDYQRGQNNHEERQIYCRTVNDERWNRVCAGYGYWGKCMAKQEKVLFKKWYVREGTHSQIRYSYKTIITAWWNTSMCVYYKPVIVRESFLQKISPLFAYFWWWWSRSCRLTALTSEWKHTTTAKAYKVLVR